MPGKSGFFGRGVGPRPLARQTLPDPVPVAGANVVSDGDFTIGTGWLTDAGVTVGSGIATWSGAAAAAAVYRNAFTVGLWYRLAFDLLSATAGTFAATIGGVDVSPRVSTPQLVFGIGRCISSVTAGIKSASSGAGTGDNLAAYPLALASLLSTRVYASAACDLSAAVTCTAGTQAGFVARLDSAATPANFIIAYLDGGGNVKVDKCVAGVYTNVISGAVSYVAGRVLRLVCSGNDVSAYYNGTQVGSTVTVSDAGIVSNTRHGLFSTYAANTFAGYVAA